MSKPNIYDLEFAERMNTLMKKHGGSIASFAQKLEVTPPTVARWIKGEADPSRTNLIRIAETTGVSIKWLTVGKKTPSKVSSIEERSNLKDLAEDDITMIVGYSSINVSAGYGSFNEGVTESDCQEPYSDNLLRNLKVIAGNCAVFWANGDSMSPTISDGDQLLVDLSKKEPKGDNRIYLVQNGESVWVKRVIMEWEGVELISDNNTYRPIKISADEAQNLQIIGQVVHIGHSLV